MMPVIQKRHFHILLKTNILHITFPPLKLGQQFIGELEYDIAAPVAGINEYQLPGRWIQCLLFLQK
ncbi:MAG: hypothetical protein JWP38_750 [Herbaspirillum sp.]|nr:hypothetical protein [Herbaspirillum sp.]